MKYVASYYFSADRTQNESAPTMQLVVEKIEEWLSSKGIYGDDGTILLLPGGRTGTINREKFISRAGQAATISLDESIDAYSATLRTAVAVGENAQETVVSIRMSVARDALAPLGFVVKAPRLVQLILEASDAWTFHNLPSKTCPMRVRGRNDGSRLSQLLWDEKRSVPVIAIANDANASLPRGIDDDLARELAGLAIVAELDAEAALQLTDERGSEWSCYGGAIRLYWPGINEDSRPLSNPLWTASQLAFHSERESEASRMIRDQLRRQIFEQSALAMPQAPLVQEIRSSVLAEEFERLAEHAEEKDSLAQALLSDGTEAERRASQHYEALQRQADEIDELKEENRELRAKLRELLQSQAWSSASIEDIPPSVEVPPITVAAAVQRAQEELEGILVFGRAVEESVLGLASDAGPPQKVLNYLRELGELTIERRRGPLGMDALMWLRGRNVEASGESESIRNSGSERRKRTWDDGQGASRFFEHHLKPSTASTGDYCVRIYFDYDDSSQTTMVGWVGQHP